ncbi:MAG: 1-acyl-sn-glycerol-3-phosphate acyltransferase [Chloroflexi bacterium]|nr:1-acyl-sn-glycerol-3-phosphate acyltransferase [Chloroflexota bacterium]
MSHRIFHNLFCCVFRVLFFLLTRLRVYGRENIPRKGGYIAAANHLSIIEVPLAYCLLKRYDVTGLIAKKHQKNPFFRFMINALDGIWLNREEIDTRALKAARDHLKGGGVLGVAPEGTRSDTGALLQAKTGIAFLADQADVPILPVAVSGTWQITSEILTFRRPVIKVNVGEPFSLPKVDRKERDKDLRRNTDEIMCQLAALLPPENRGVYANHPRVLELLQLQANH